MRQLLLPALAATLALTACVSDELVYCPALSVELAVKDYNFFNVKAVPEEQPRPENLPFRDYIPTISWTLRDAKTGVIVEQEELQPVDGVAPRLPISFCDCVPHGTYIFTAYGNMSHAADIEPSGRVLLHPDNTEHNDPYFACDTLLYDPYHDHYQLEMERAKGELIIEVENLDIAAPDITVRCNGVAAEVDPTDERPLTRFAYYGDTWFEKRQPKAQMLKVLSAPTLSGDPAVLHVEFSGADAQGHSLVRVPDDITIEEQRNTITVVRYVWQEHKEGQFTVYVLINGSWESVSHMDVD